MNSEVDGGSFPHLVNLLFNLFGNLQHHLFDTGRMNTTIRYQLMKRQPGNLSPNRIEGRQNDGFRGVINDNLHTRYRFESADISPFTANNPALNLVVLNMKHRNRVLNCSLGSNTLNGLNHHLLSLFRGSHFGLFHGFVDERHSLSPSLCLQ